VGIRIIYGVPSSNFGGLEAEKTLRRLHFVQVAWIQSGWHRINLSEDGDRRSLFDDSLFILHRNNAHTMHIILACNKLEVATGSRGFVINYRRGLGDLIGAIYLRATRPRIPRPLRKICVWPQFKLRMTHITQAPCSFTMPNTERISMLSLHKFHSGNWITENTFYRRGD